MKRLAAVVLALAVAGCATRQPAPVVDRQPPSQQPPVAEAPKAPEPPPAEKPLPTHVVKRGETLVGIALQYGLDYRELAAWNNITNVNVISVGQVLVVARPSGAQPAAGTADDRAASTALGAKPLASAGPPIEARPLANTNALKVEPRGEKVPYSDRALAQMGSAPPVTSGEAPSPPVAAPAPPPVAAPPLPTPPAAPEPEKSAGTDAEDVNWMWPVKGKLIAPFSEAAKGVDIGGKKGTPVLAAAAGRVVYAGSGLRGYGNLVIISHNDTWLSAYAHNEVIHVKEQQVVKKGQKIAEMGSTGSDQVKLHFEVRRKGKPVDPAKVLPPM
jgi:lipoprotein NlpD